MKKRKKTGKKIEKILIIRQRGIGDIILSLPTIRSIGKGFPDAHIALLLDYTGAELFTGILEVNEIIVLKKGLLLVGKIVKIIRERLKKRFYTHSVNMTKSMFAMQINLKTTEIPGIKLIIKKINIFYLEQRLWK